MKTEKSKIDGVGIIPLRCEICFGSITQEEPLTALLKDNSMHFVHTECYLENEPEYIIKKMNDMSNRTKNDQELFGLMEEESAKKDTNS